MPFLQIQTIKFVGSIKKGTIKSDLGFYCPEAGREKGVGQGGRRGWGREGEGGGARRKMGILEID